MLRKDALRSGNKVRPHKGVRSFCGTVEVEDFKTQLLDEMDGLVVAEGGFCAATVDAAGVEDGGADGFDVGEVFRLWGEFGVGHEVEVSFWAGEDFEAFGFVG